MKSLIVMCVAFGTSWLAGPAHAEVFTAIGTGTITGATTYQGNPVDSDGSGILLVGCTFMLTVEYDTAASSVGQNAQVREYRYEGYTGLSAKLYVSGATFTGTTWAVRVSDNSPFGAPHDAVLFEAVFADLPDGLFKIGVGITDLSQTLLASTALPGVGFQSNIGAANVSAFGNVNSLENATSLRLQLDSLVIQSATPAPPTGLEPGSGAICDGGTDPDDDDVLTVIDNCPTVFNPVQENTDVVTGELVVLIDDNSDELEPGATISREGTDGPMTGDGVEFFCGSCSENDFTESATMIGNGQPLCGYFTQVAIQIIQNGDVLCARATSTLNTFDITLLSWNSPAFGCIDADGTSCGAAGGGSSYRRLGEARDAFGDACDCEDDGQCTAWNGTAGFCDGSTAERTDPDCVLDVCVAQVFDQCTDGAAGSVFYVDLRNVDGKLCQLPCAIAGPDQALACDANAITCEP